MALARALVNRPRVLLLDEPLGALDLKLREEMQIELKGLQRRLGITFVYVTHDQGEALSMSDRVAVFNHGRIEQLAPPRDLYARPRTAFVARFVGSANVIEGRLPQRLRGQLRSRSRCAPSRSRRWPPPRHCPTHTSSMRGVLLDVQYHGATSRWQVQWTRAWCIARRAARRCRCRTPAPSAPRLAARPPWCRWLRGQAR